jgi:ornithine carbamoyltransferase
MANSWINAAAKPPFHLDLACPEGYDRDNAILNRGMAGAEVIDGRRSVVMDEAENRLHVQKVVMEILMR